MAARGGPDDAGPAQPVTHCRWQHPLAGARRAGMRPVLPASSSQHDL